MESIVCNHITAINVGYININGLYSLSFNQSSRQVGLRPRFSIDKSTLSQNHPLIDQFLSVFIHWYITQIKKNFLPKA